MARTIVTIAFVTCTFMTWAVLARAARVGREHLEGMALDRRALVDVASEHELCSRFGEGVERSGSLLER